MKEVGLARRAMEAYAVPIASITPLKDVYNTTFRIIAQSGERYVLRISHPRRTSVEVVRSELLWLVALRQETDLQVPDPVRNRKTQYVTVIADADVPRPRLCALFHWTNGRFLSRTLTPRHLLRVGELMARLHDHAMQWEQPTGFTRPRIANLNPLHQERDDDFDEAIASLAIHAVASVSAPQHGMVVAAVIQRVWKVLQELGEEPADFGLIHADVHQWNYLFHKGQVGVIDFDDCGYGHWLYDLAVTPYCLADHPDFVTLKDAFLTGYRRTRPLSAEQEEHLETFMALRRLQDLLWVIEERDKPAFRDRWQAQMIDGLQKLREFISH
ncbi:phosphotransferase [Candidatus Bipolaricaulota bacterium]|nr:phosphotransferase [Candidatus Bipolaricaulota bacterium]